VTSAPPLLVTPPVVEDNDSFAIGHDLNVIRFESCQSIQRLVAGAALLSMFRTATLLARFKQTNARLSSEAMTMAAACSPIGTSLTVFTLLP
jgi:hypothetical protein